MTCRAEQLFEWYVQLKFQVEKATDSEKRENEEGEKGEERQVGIGGDGGSGGGSGVQQQAGIILFPFLDLR